jgi:IS30 family transposase
VLKLLCTDSLKSQYPLSHLNLDKKLSVRNIDLPMKTKLNTKTKRVRKHHRILGTSIAERPLEIEDREEFGHLEIDTVEGKKSDDNALLTFIERKSRFYYAIKIDDQDHDSADHGIKQLQNYYVELFPQVFKTITSDNGSEFSNLTASLAGITDVCFARPYAS